MAVRDDSLSDEPVVLRGGLSGESRGDLRGEGGSAMDCTRDSFFAEVNQSAAVTLNRRNPSRYVVWPENSIYLKQREIIPGAEDNAMIRCQSAWTRSVSC